MRAWLRWWFDQIILHSQIISRQRQRWPVFKNPSCLCVGSWNQLILHFSYHKHGFSSWKFQKSYSPVISFSRFCHRFHWFHGSVFLSDHHFSWMNEFHISVAKNTIYIYIHPAVHNIPYSKYTFLFAKQKNEYPVVLKQIKYCKYTKQSTISNWHIIPQLKLIPQTENGHKMM